METRNNQNYSQEFYAYFENGDINIKSDSLLFPKEAGFETIIIPTYLILNKEYHFNDNQKQELIIKRINFTDIEFEIIRDDSEIKGTASLPPTFYLGMESVGTSEGEFWIDIYDVKNKDIKCLTTIGIGHQNISEENQSDLYAFLYFESNCQSNRIKDYGELFWIKK